MTRRFSSVPPNPFKTGGPEVRYEIEEWSCACRTWEVVTATYTWKESEDRWMKESWWVRTCGYCRTEPRPGNFGL